MRSLSVAASTRPLQGRVAFVRAAAILSVGGRDAATHPAMPMSSCQLDRDEDQVHPGEGSA